MSKHRLGGLGLLASLFVGCNSAPWRPQLFVIRAPDPDYPVMMSRVRAVGSGRRLAASSGVEASVTESGMPAGNGWVQTVVRRSAASELPAYAKFFAEVRRKDRWVQIDEADFFAKDKAEFGRNSCERSLTLKGSVHR